MLEPLHTAYQGNYHIEIRFGQRHGDSSSVTGEVDGEIGIFGDVS